MRRKTKLEKRIDHVQKGLKADTIWLKRPLNEAAELANLIGEQFDDQNKHTIKKDV